MCKPFLMVSAWWVNLFKFLSHLKSKSLLKQRSSVPSLWKICANMYFLLHTNKQIICRFLVSLHQPHSSSACSFSTAVTGACSWVSVAAYPQHESNALTFRFGPFPHNAGVHWLDSNFMMPIKNKTNNKKAWIDWIPLLSFLYAQWHCTSKKGQLAYFIVWKMPGTGQQRHNILTSLHSSPLTPQSWKTLLVLLKPVQKIMQ